VGIGDAGGVGIGRAGGVGIGGAGGRGAGGVGMGGVGPGAGAAGEGRTALAAAIVLSVDGFAALNDAGGRGAGELLLAQLARRLKLMASPRDMVARWGGEEFAVLIEGRTAQGGEMAGYAETLEIAERLTRSVPSEPFRLGDADVTVTVSAGVAFVPRPSGQHRPGGEGGPAGQIWRNAELAMSHARELGGNRVEVYGGPPADVSQAETELLSG
jgi:diguanylate cyclase (GGDEF)-like protein